MRIIICFLIFLFSSNALAASAKFKCPAVPPKESQAIKKAGTYFATAEKMAINGAYKKSLERYLCSLKMKAHPNTMFNIAQVAKLIDNKGPALQELKKFRNRNPDHPSVGEINTLIEKMERGELNPEPVDATAPQPETTVAETDASTTDTVATSEPLPAPSPVKADTATKLRRLRIAGIILVSSDAVFTVVAIGLSGGAAKARSDAESSTVFSDFDTYDQKHRNLTGGAVFMWITGTALLTTGIILLLKAKRKRNATADQPSPVAFGNNGTLLTF